ncbi:MAG: glycosyltransferase family 39 protein [candidate division KSB1 bacterium]|nr:glycosyltransferase family 39 protein [candidate division KSB1 bacterium]
MFQPKSKHTFYSWLPLVASILFILLPVEYAISLFVISMLVLFLIPKYYANDPLFAQLLILAIVLRIGILIVNVHIQFLPDQPDAAHYSRQGLQIATNISKGYPLFDNVEYSTSVKSYGLFLGLLYIMVGQTPLVAAVLNVLFGVLSGVYIYKITLLVFKDKTTALVTGAIMLFLPSAIAFTSFVLRDPLILLLTLILLYHLLRIQTDKRRTYDYWTSLITFILVGILRIQNFYLYTLFFIIFFIFLFLNSKIKSSKKILFVLFILIFLSILIYQFQDHINAVITYPLRAQPHRIEGGSAYLLHMEYNTLSDVIRYLPIRFIYFTYGPFLWDVGGLFQIFSAIEGFFICIASILTLFYVVKFKRYRNSQEIFILMFCLLGLLANSMVDSNFGTAVRHRLNYIIFFFMFAVVYIRHIKFKL